MSAFRGWARRCSHERIAGHSCRLIDTPSLRIHAAGFRPLYCAAWFPVQMAKRTNHRVTKLLCRPVPCRLSDMAHVRNKGPFKAVSERHYGKRADVAPLLLRVDNTVTARSKTQWIMKLSTISAATGQPLQRIVTSSFVDVGVQTRISKVCFPAPSRKRAVVRLDVVRRRANLQTLGRSRPRVTALCRLLSFSVQSALLRSLPMTKQRPDSGTM